MSNHTPAWAENIRVCQFQGVEKFYDILPLLADGDALGKALNAIMDLANKGAGGRLCGEEKLAELIVSAEARGFIFGSAVASANELGLVLARKPGHTPGTTATATYGKEYGRDTLEIQCGLIHEGDRVIIVDDLVATGGTLKAVADMVEAQGGKVLAIVTLIELTGLNGRQVLEDAGHKLLSVLQY